jgi:hypothetical protein
VPSAWRQQQRHLRPMRAQQPSVRLPAQRLARWAGADVAVCGTCGDAWPAPDDRILAPARGHHNRCISGIEYLQPKQRDIKLINCVCRILARQPKLTGHRVWYTLQGHLNQDQHCCRQRQQWHQCT